LVAEFSNNKSIFPFVGKLFSTTFVDRRGGKINYDRREDKLRLAGKKVELCSKYCNFYLLKLLIIFTI
jgi:hypothetical protein